MCKQDIAPIKGKASWYGPGFQGKKTANGEIFDTNKLTAAMRTIPLGTRVVVTNNANGKSVTVTVNDRGPYADTAHRVIDLSKAAFSQIADPGSGVIQSVTVTPVANPK